MTLAMALQFYTFNENFAELTAVLAGGLVIGFAVADRVARRKALKLAGLTAIAYVGAIILSAPYLIYSLKHYQRNLQRQDPVYSTPLIRLIVPPADKMFGLTSLMRYSHRLRLIGTENYVGIPLIVILLMLAVFAWRKRITWLLLIGFVFVIALAVGPHVVVTSFSHTYNAAVGRLVGAAVRAQCRTYPFHRLRGPGARDRPGALAGRAGQGQTATGGALGHWPARGRRDHHGLVHVLYRCAPRPAGLHSTAGHAPG
jgi:hypothetical protein